MGYQTHFIVKLLKVQKKLRNVQTVCKVELDFRKSFMMVLLIFWELETGFVEKCLLIGVLCQVCDKEYFGIECILNCSYESVKYKYISLLLTQ